MNVLGLAAPRTEYDAPRHPVASPCRVPLRLRGLVVDEQERFWAKVDRRGTYECWLWTGSLAGEGYGYFTAGGRRMRVHRFAYELLVGPIPAGLSLDHLCRNRGCVNPTHLEPVTLGVNTLRGIGPAAVNARLTHCLRGHAFSPENTYRPPVGGRECRTCKRALRNAYRAHRRALGLPINRAIPS